MKNIALILLAVISLAALSMSIMNRPPKIGYAETAIILDQFTEAIKARKKFQEAQAGWDANLKTLNDSLMSAMDNMKAGFDKASPARKDSLRFLLESRNGDLQKYSNAIRKMSQEKEQELMSPILKQVNGFMEIWGKQHGYDLILGANSSGNILRANQSLNVTSDILKELNSQYKDLPMSDSASAKTSADGSGKSVP